MIHIIRSRAEPEQMRQMLEALGIYIKLAVDIERRILVGGGELHADCELVFWMMAVSRLMFGVLTGIH